MNRRTKRTTIVAILSFAGSAYAVAPGFYLGLEAGQANLDAKPKTAQLTIPPGGTTLVTPTKKQFGGRLFLGYKFNPWVGWETGLNFFSVINYHTEVPRAQTCTRPKVRIGSFDAVLKPSATFGPVDVYAKAGIDINDVNNTASLNTSGSCGNSTHRLTFGPVYGLGASYDLTQNWVADIGWTRLHIGRFINNIDFFAIGITYHIVNVYCGQFLCD